MRTAVIVASLVGATAVAFVAAATLGGDDEGRRFVERSVALVGPKSAMARRPISRKLEVGLGTLATLAERIGANRALRRARTAQVEVVGRRVQVIVEGRPGRSEQVNLLIKRVGGTVEARSAPLFEVLLPPAALLAVARDEAVRFVRPPIPNGPAKVGGEGVRRTGASRWHAAGVTGRGVTVAIIDLGFESYRLRQRERDLPQTLATQNFCAKGLEGDEDHGTAVAEIVYEVAPRARLLLICVDTEVGLAKAAAYARRAGATIISHSMVWFNSGRGDGQGAPGTPDAIVAETVRSGVLWVNAAGNSASQHWSGRFSDPDSDGFHNFSGADELNRIARGCAYLKWDEWPMSSQDFNLYVYESSRVLARSENLQRGSQAPVEAVCVPSSPGTFEIAIARAGGSASPRLDLFSKNADFEYAISAGSVLEPSSSPSAFAVGAVCWDDDSIESYSSRGPTIDGRSKPDVAAPAGVSGATYGRSSGCGTGFLGTSASAPHVAGLAALLKQRFPQFSPADLRAYFERNAVDLALPGRDNDTGAGKVLLPAP